MDDQVRPPFEFDTFSSDRGPSKAFERPALLCALLAFALSLFLDTRHNRFPLNYHPDESSKVKQIASHKRNFHHPLLLLTGAETMLRLSGTARTSEQIVVLGRTFTAMCAAGVVACFTLLAASRFGLLAGVIAGIVTMLDAPLFDLAHYMKEDPQLMFGLALTFLALELARRGVTRGRVIFLGIAAATAFSGKYLGVVALPIALSVVWFSTADPAQRRPWLIVFSTAFVATFLVLNYSLLLHPSGMLEGILRGSRQAATGHTGLTRSVPHLGYVPAFVSAIPWPLTAFAAFHLVSLSVRARRAHLVEWQISLFPPAYFAMLSFSPEVSPRYLLPVTSTTCLLAALGAAELAVVAGKFGPAPARRIIPALVSLAALGLLVRAELPAFTTLYRDYLSDDHLVLEDWIRTNLPAATTIAQDDRASLPRVGDAKHGGDRPMPQTILTADFAADLGPLVKLRGDGVEYVAVCFTTYGRFLDRAQVPSSAAQSAYVRRKDFYEQLFREGKLIWEKPSGRVLYLHPGLRLYRIGKVSDPAFRDPAR